MSEIEQSDSPADDASFERETQEGSEGSPYSTRHAVQGRVLPCPGKAKVTDLDEGRLLTIKQCVVQFHITAAGLHVEEHSRHNMPWCWSSEQMKPYTSLPVCYMMLMAVADGTNELLHGKGDISISVPAYLRLG